jgi:uncharacterized protein (DUF4213/DUF364 family)
MSDNIDKLVELTDFYLFIQNRINYFSMREMFGEAMAEHLLPKWDSCNGNVLNFMTMLDADNRRKLIAWGVKSYERAI